MPPAGFEPTAPTSERPQIRALDRAATVTGRKQLTLPVSLRLDRGHRLLRPGLRRPAWHYTECVLVAC